MIKENRLPKYDNIYFFTILLVVIGHMIDQFTDKSGAFKSLFLFIVSFHMPLLIFVEGLFHKPIKREDSFNWQKFIFLLLISYLLRIICYIIKSIDHSGAKINWFTGSELPWLLAVLALFMVVVFVVSRLHINPFVAVGISLVLGCTSGYFYFIKDFLWLSRFFVFLPFYLIGYYLTPQKIISFTNKLYIRIPAVLLGIVWFALCFWQRDLLYPLRGLFTGRNPFASIKSIVGCGIGHRAISYLIMVLICIAVISAIPNIKIPLITHMGSNALAAFFWHRPIMYILEYAGVFTFLLKLPKKIWMIIVISIAIVMCLVLMIDIFSWPLKKLQDIIDKNSNKACILILIVIIIFGIAFTIQEGIKL